MEQPLVKVYPAKYWGDPVVLMGNQEGLEALKEVIDQALSNIGRPYCADVEETTNEGEASYKLIIRAISNDELKGWADLPAQADELSQEERMLLNKFADCDEVYL